jgi:hypothetical protein
VEWGEERGKGIRKINYVSGWIGWNSVGGRVECEKIQEIF